MSLRSHENAVMLIKDVPLSFCTSRNDGRACPALRGNACNASRGEPEPHCLWPEDLIQNWMLEEKKKRQRKTENPYWR